MCVGDRHREEVGAREPDEHPRDRVEGLDASRRRYVTCYNTDNMI